MDAAIIVNVSRRAHVCRRGVLGSFIVPPIDAETGEFGMLVVRSQGEVQDVGNSQRKRGDAIEAKALAKDIVGEQGERLGLLICAADAEEPRALEKAEREERDFLNNHPGEVKNRLNPVTKIREFWTADEPDDKKEKILLSARVMQEREKFFSSCRALVTGQEIAKAEANLVAYYQDLVREANRLWSREVTRAEVNEHHKFAAVELGLDDLPWCSVPMPRQDCPGCSEKVKIGAAICPKCGWILDEQKVREQQALKASVMVPAAAPQPQTARREAK